VYVWENEELQNLAAEKMTAEKQQNLPQKMKNKGKESCRRYSRRIVLVLNCTFHVLCAKPLMHLYVVLTAYILFSEANERNLLGIQ
jgi:hypothetical protein